MTWRATSSKTSSPGPTFLVIVFNAIIKPEESMLNQHLVFERNKHVVQSRNIKRGRDGQWHSAEVLSNYVRMSRGTCMSWKGET